MRRTATACLAPALCLALLLVPGPRPGAAEEGPEGPAGKAPAPAAAAARGLRWLTDHQEDNGSWRQAGTARSSGTYSIAVTSFGALAYLAGADEPFAGPHGHALRRALGYLVAHQEEGRWPKQGHTWIHGQGFATLALAEALPRLPGAVPGADRSRALLRAIVGKAVRLIEASQSASGGWWYTEGEPHNHEGSTTCCAVQALVAARGSGVATDPAVLERGFEYLKKCQNEDGGFDYKLGDAASMKEGTAGGVATLGLMRKFDYTVMMKGYEYLLALGPDAITKERFPYYGHFYGLMGMRLLGQEFEPFRPKIRAYADAALAALGAWQREDGSWPVKGWIQGQKQDDAYATAFAALLFSIDAGRLGIFIRDRPRPTPPPAKGGERARAGNRPALSGARCPPSRGGGTLRPGRQTTAPAEGLDRTPPPARRDKTCWAGSYPRTTSSSIS